MSLYAHIWSFIAYIEFAKSRFAPESRIPNSIGLAIYLGMLWEAFMGLLDLIKEDESLEFISLKEAINLLAEKTNSNIFEVATYLLNKKVESSLDCYARSSNYKIELTSSCYGETHWCGENYAFELLMRIVKTEGFNPPLEISKWSKYRAEGERNYWNRSNFLDLDCIKELNVFSVDDVNLDKRQQYIWDKNYLNMLKNDVPDLENGDYEQFDDSFTNYLNETELTTDQEESTAKQKENQLPPHIKILTMNDYFTVVESACFISFDEPEKMQAYIDSGDFTYDAWRYGEHIQAVKVIENGIRANNLDIEDDGMIPRVSLQRFLYERNHVISGFNDNQQLLILPRYGDPSIGYASPESYQKERAQLLKEFKQLKSELEQEKLQSSLLILDNQSSLSETNQLKARITELEAAQPKSINSDVQLSPEQEIPNSRQRNNILKIISILSGMAGLPPEHFKAFNMMDVHAAQNNIDIPSKHTVADWLKKARDSN